MLLAGRLICAGVAFETAQPDWSSAAAPEDALAELHSFAWLDDLAELGRRDARERGRALATSWVHAAAAWNPVAWQPEILATRIVAWLSHARFLFADADDRVVASLLGSLSEQVRHLVRTANSSAPGVARLVVAKALVYAGLCGFGRRPMRRGLGILTRELPVQVLPDGGHVERCPERHARALATLVDIAGMLAVGAAATPPRLTEAIAAMTPILRLFRHGDGGLAHFNHGKWLSPALIDVLLSRAAVRADPPMEAPSAGFVRLAAGDTLLLVDAGAPPPAPFDRQAHGGTLSFEMSSRRERLVVNCGARDDGAWRDAARATAAHSTVVVNDTNSSELLANGIGRRPTHVDRRVESADGNHWVTASHDGYRSNFDVLHRRRIYVAADGNDIRGEDTLTGGSGDFAVRFHLHPDVRASLVQNAAAVLLQTAAGSAWRMQANGTLRLAESVYFGDGSAPRRSEQIVLTGTHGGGETVVKWAFRSIARAKAAGSA